LHYPEKNLFLSTTKGKTEIYEILNHLKSLKYEDRPDYEFIYNRIREMRSKELTRIFHQRYSNSVFQDNIFFDFLKNNSNILPFNNNICSNNYNNLQQYLSSSHNNNNNINKINEYYNNNNPNSINNNNHFNNNFGNELNNFPKFVGKLNTNSQNQNFCNNPNAINPIQNLNLSYVNFNQNSNINYKTNNNNGFNLSCFNQEENGLPGNNTKICPNNHQNKKNANAINRNNSLNNTNNNQIYNNNNNFDFANNGNLNANCKNTNYANLDVLKNLYMDQIELESNKRIIKEEMFNLNNLKTNFYSNPNANKKCVDSVVPHNIYAKNSNNYNPNNNMYNANIDDAYISKKINIPHNIPNRAQLQQQNLGQFQNQFNNLPAEITSNINEYNLENLNKNNNNSNFHFLNNGNTGEANIPDSGLLQSNISKINYLSIMKNYNNNLERVESIENNLSNLSNGINLNNENNNFNNYSIGKNNNNNNIPSLFKKEGLLAANQLNFDSNLAANLYSNSDNFNTKDALTKKKRNRKNSLFNQENIKAQKENSIASNIIKNKNIYNQKNQIIENKGKSANSKKNPISKSEFPSGNINQNNKQQVSWQEEIDSPLIDSVPIDSNIIKDMNFNNTNSKININNNEIINQDGNRSLANNLLSPNITNNNTNLSNNNQNQIFIINQTSKNNNLTEFEKDLINYFLNYETKNTSAAPLNNSNDNNAFYPNNPINSNNISKNFNSGVNNNNHLEPYNFDKILSKLLKENLLKLYIQSNMPNILGNGINNNRFQANTNNFFDSYGGYLNNIYINNNNENANKTNLLYDVVDLLKNKNIDLVNNNNTYGLNDTFNKSNFKNTLLSDSPISAIFNKFLEQSANNIFNTNLKKFGNTIQNLDPLCEILINNSNNLNINNSNYNDFLNLNSTNFLSNAISPNKIDKNFNNVNNNNFSNLQNILNPNFFEKPQSFDPRLNIGSVYNQNYKIQNLDNYGFPTNMPTKNINLRNNNIKNQKLKEPLLIRNDLELLDLKLQNNFFNSLLQNEENLNLLNSAYKNNLFANDLATIKKLNTIKKQNSSNINNFNNNNFNVNNYPNNMDNNLNLSENNNFVLNDLDNFNFNTDIKCFDDEILLLKLEMESRINPLCNYKNLIPQQAQNKILSNENFNYNNYQNSANDPNYVLLYNLLKQENINNSRDLNN
jgi:hypothetical protein